MKQKRKCLVDEKYKNAKEYWKLLKATAIGNSTTAKSNTILANTFAKYFKSNQLSKQ